MAATISPQRLRGLFAAYLVAVAAVTGAFALAAFHSVHPWILGEWLINDAGGFVRRGPFGSALLLASRSLHLPLLPLLSAVQLLVYAAWYLAVFRLTRAVRWSLPLIACLVSPATLAFTVLDPPSSVRKEALLFLALASLLLLLQSRRRDPQLIALYLLLVVAPSLVLLHEGLLPFLPYLFAPLLLVWPWRTALRIAAAPALAAALAAVAVLSHPGDQPQAQAICQALAASLPHTAAVRLNSAEPGGLCNGAIAYLGMTPAAARAETARAVHVYHYARIYPLAAVLALLPSALLLGRRWRNGSPLNRSRARILARTALVSVLLSLPLFVIARDWGRWIHIHATALMLLCLAAEHTSHLPSLDDQPSSRQQGIALTLSGWRSCLAACLVALYAVTWTLPAVGIFPGRLGYFDLFRYLKSYRSKPHLSSPPIHHPDTPDARGVLAPSATRLVTRNHRVLS